MPTIKAYKLFRIRKDNTISSLFINTKARYNLNEWMQAQRIQTKGYSYRPGWHTLAKPRAPHLSLKGRAWYLVEIANYSEETRPSSQGGKWYRSQHLKILRPLTIAEKEHTLNYEDAKLY